MLAEMTMDRSTNFNWRVLMGSPVSWKLAQNCRKVNIPDLYAPLNQFQSIAVSHARYVIRHQSRTGEIVCVGIPSFG